MRVLIAGGGTGGHLYPGIAVARELQRRDPSAHVSFVGTAQGIEARVVPREKFPLDLIRVTGLKGKSRLERSIGLSLLPLAAIDAWRVVAKQRPDVVVGVGGLRRARWSPSRRCSAIRRCCSSRTRCRASPIDYWRASCARHQ